MERKGNLVALTGIIVTVVSLLVFVLLLPPLSIIGWLCLVFAIVAELVAFAAALVLQQAGRGANKTLLNAGMVALLGGYMVLSVGLSLVFRILFAPLWGLAGLFVSLQLILLAAMVVAMLAVLHFALRAGNSDGEVLGRVDKMRSLGQHIALLATNMEAESAAALTAAAEEMLYTDLTVVVEGDTALQEAVAELDIAQSKPEPDAGELEELVARIQKLVRQRKILLSHVKHGRT